VLPQKWILIVDDDQDILDSLRELLIITFGEDNLKILEANDGLEAAGKIKNQKFDCIITDMKMPKKEGEALISSVRQNPMNVDTPIIMLTAFPNRRLLNEFRFIYLMEKPFLHNELTQLVATQLKIGNSGGRLAADMVNSLVSATTLFLESALANEKVTLESPLAKRQGEDLKNEYTSQVNIYDQGVYNSFSILVKEEDLKNFSNKLVKIQNRPLKDIAFAMGQSILKYAMRNMNQSSAYNILTLTGDESSKNIKPKKGIIIPISCGDVQLRLFACGEKKKAS
jgi:CheY-like chemotaxis protein